jgi:SagB-type dehydrogenase family enzyme
VLSVSVSHVDRLLDDSARSAHVLGGRQLLLVITARFHRFMWKYGLGSYATIMKNTGVLLATMQLVATAMGLAPCALGGGDSELFALAIWTPFEEETSVGELMLGSAPRR